MNFTREREIYSNEDVACTLLKARGREINTTEEVIKSQVKILKIHWLIREIYTADDIKSAQLVTFYVYSNRKEHKRQHEIYIKQNVKST